MKYFAATCLAMASEGIARSFFIGVLHTAMIFAICNDSGGAPVTEAGGRLHLLPKRA